MGVRACLQCGMSFDARRCPECEKARKRKWKADNPEKVKAGKAKWRVENPEKAKAATAKWQAAKRQQLNAYSKKWRAEHPEAVRINHQNRRARKRRSGGKLSAGLADKLFKSQKGKCPCCREPLGDDYHLDHKMPLALGGVNEDRNMQLLRRGCNKLKHARHPVEFMQSRGFLL